MPYKIVHIVHHNALEIQPQKMFYYTILYNHAVMSIFNYLMT